MVTLKWDAGKYVNIEIFDLTGRPVIQSMRLSGGRKYIDTKDWIPGIYFVRINGNHAGRLIVNH